MRVQNCQRVCICVCFGCEAAGAAASSFCSETGGSGCIGYICLHAGQPGMTGNTPRLQKLYCSALQPPRHPMLLISPPFFWTLEASIPPSALALIITKDRMHKTWRTLRQRRPKLPPPHPSTLSPGTIRGPLWPVTLTTHTPSFCPPLFLCHALPLPLC